MRSASAMKTLTLLMVNSDNRVIRYLPGIDGIRYDMRKSTDSARTISAYVILRINIDSTEVMIRIRTRGGLGIRVWPHSGQRAYIRKSGEFLIVTYHDNRPRRQVNLPLRVAYIADYLSCEHVLSPPWGHLPLV